jgi:hypothetical protein
MQFSRDRNAKLMIFRNDRSGTPHLLISWENLSKEVDVHLKSRSAGGQEYPNYLAKIPESDFVKLFKSFEPAFMQSINANLCRIPRVRPGWLGHRGYAVFYMDEREKSQMMDRIAPLRKYHGKWERVPDMQAFEDWTNSPEIINNIYHPSILHDIAANGYDDIIMAGRIRGKHKPKSMALCLVKSSNGRASWVNLDRLIQSMMGISETSTLLCLKQLLPKDAWTTIFNELHLEEVGFELA